MTLAFGDHVAIKAFLVRTIANPGGVYRQQSTDIDGSDLANTDAWPGEPVPLDWQAGRFGETFYDVEPSPNGSAVVRLRRHLLHPPATGIVIGASRRFEGKLHKAAGGATTESRSRTIPVIEVAVAPRTRSTSGYQATRAVVVCTHENDLVVLERAPAPVASSELAPAGASRAKGPFRGRT